MPRRQCDHVGDLRSLIVRLEELVIANSGADVFEEVLKLLIAKIQDERSGSHHFERLDSPEACRESVSALLKAAKVDFSGVLLDTDSRLQSDHLQVCVEMLSRHRVSDATFEVLDGCFEHLIAAGAKAAKGQYFTPRHVIEFCVQLVKPRPGETVLDPACGSGGFLIHAANYVRSVDPTARLDLTGLDIDARAVRVARILMHLSGGDGKRILERNTLAGDVLTEKDLPRDGFDVILTNPPFAGEVKEPALLDAYALGRGRERVERDVLFLERCIELLRPGGRMAIVLPHNKFAVATWAYARTWLMQQARVMAVVSLGRNTFLPHTHQKANVLCLRRKLPGEQFSGTEKTLLAISEREGKNSRGQEIVRRVAPQDALAWSRLDHDLEEIVNAFGRFRCTEGSEAGW